MQRTVVRRSFGGLLVVAGASLVGCARNATGAKKEAPVRLEPVAGTDLKRVILTPKAAERLNVQTAPLQEGPVARTRTVGGEIVSPLAGAGTVPAPAPAFTTLSLPGAAGLGAADIGGLLVRVRLTDGDFEVLEREQPVRVMPLNRQLGRRIRPGAVPLPATGGSGAMGTAADGGAGGVPARPVAAPAGAADSSPSTLYYAVDSPASGFAAGQRVFVQLPLTGSGVRKIVPYSAVLYDLSGTAWIYVSPQRLTYVRQRVVVDYIDGERVMLVEGPPAGTEIVTVGAMEIFGAESGVGGK